MFKNDEVKRPRKERREKLLPLVVFLLSFLLLISLFKNISYPLFWADEGYTVMGGVRVLQFGYPKVHDGKNVFYELMHTDKTLGIDKQTDAYIGGANWGQYYIAAIGVKLAEMSDDLFTKTALIRILFALIGLAGLFLLALLGAHFFSSRTSKTGFLALFILLELLSVPLVLHLREARYYPLAVFISALVLLIFSRNRILGKTSYPRYVVQLVISLFLLCLTFSPAYFAFLSAITIFETAALASTFLVRVIRKDRAGDETPAFRIKTFNNYLRNIVPCLVSIVTVYPVMIFFDSFHIAEELTKYYAWGFKTDAAGLYLSNLYFIWSFFAYSDLIYLAIFLKIAGMTCVAVKFVGEKTVPPFDMPKFMISSFLSTLFIIYFFLIPKIPNPLFTRYFIPLQPVLTLIIIMDAAMIFSFIARYQSRGALYFKRAFVACMVAFVLVNVSNNSQFLSGHVYELTHRYRGPLDYIVPFVQEKYGKTDDLVIATNYEETSFMYYLNSKVIVGYDGNNMEEFAQSQPDIIVYRKSWFNHQPVFLSFIQRHPYEEISFPVYDHLVNNIPELHSPPPFQHQFRTQDAEDEWKKTYMFVRK